MRRHLYAVRDAAIVEMHMAQGLTYTAISERLEVVSREAVHKVVRTAVGPRKTGRRPSSGTPKPKAITVTSKAEIESMTPREHIQVIRKAAGKRAKALGDKVSP